MRVYEGFLPEDHPYEFAPLQDVFQVRAVSECPMQSMVLIAPAVDITGYWWAKLSPAEREQALAERRVHLKTQYQACE